jgi:DNA-binding SARP family transcriptional activator
VDDLSFRVLGPVEVLRSGQPADLTGGTALSVIAGLLVSANQIVSAAGLGRMVWDADGPAHPDAALHSAVSRLRRLLGSEIVETVGSGYRIRVRPGNLDLLDFRRLTAAAAQESARGAGHAAVGLLDEALSLWRLPVLGNVSSVVLRRDIAPRLTDEYLDAQEIRARLCLRLGQHRRIAAELADLVSAYPFREQLAACLMEALYRAGRQADALAVYERLRRWLADELGVDPSAGLRDLHLRIVRAELAEPGQETRGEPAASPAAGRVPRQLPPDVADFTGRGAELSLARELLTAGRDGARPGPPICVLTGPGGAGKSALAVHVAHQVSAAYPDGQLYADLEGAGERPVAPGEILSRILRALGIAGPQIPPGLDERAALYRSLLASRRMLVLLDNAAGEGQIRQLLPGGPGCAVIVTARSRITGVPGGRLIQLGMLADAEGIELLGRVAGPGRISAEPEQARILVRLSGGLPLALRIVGARLAARPHWLVATMAGRLADGRQRLSELRHGDLDVRASMALSYQGLRPAEQALLRRIGLLEVPDFPAWACAALLDCGLRYAQGLVDGLADAHLLELAGHDTGERARYRCHDLIGDYVRELALAEDPAQERDAALTRAFGALLGLAGHVHRHIIGGDYTILHGRAARWLAADMRPDRIVGAEPLAWLEGERLLIVAAIRQAAALGLDEFCWDLAWTAVTLFERRGYLDDWLFVQEQALAAARRGGNRRGEAAMLTSLGSRLYYQQELTGAHAMFERGAQLFAEIGDRHGHAIAQQKLAASDMMNGRVDLALARGAQGREAAGQAGDRFLELMFTREMARMHIDRGDFAAASDLLDEAAVMSRDIGTAIADSLTLHMRGQLYLLQDQHAQAEGVFGQVLRLAQGNGDLIGQLHARLGLAEALLSQGRPGPAESQLGQVIDAAPRLRQQFVHARALLVLGQLQASRDDYRAAVPVIQASIDIFRRCQIPLWESRALDTLTAVRSAGGQPQDCGEAGLAASASQ